MAFWTKDRELELIKLWDSGLSASVIAGRMGAESRNMILGKAWRMKLMHRRSGGAEAGLTNRITTLRKVKAKPMPPPEPKKRTVRRRLSAMLVQEAPIPPSDYDVARISFNDLEPHHCKWICTPTALGPNEKQFCGCTPAPGLPFCPQHAARAYAADPRLGVQRPDAKANLSRGGYRVTLISRGVDLRTLEDA